MNHDQKTDEWGLTEWSMFASAIVGVMAAVMYGLEKYHFMVFIVVWLLAMIVCTLGRILAELQRNRKP